MLLEAALVTPVFLTLVFGVIEGGLALHTRLSVVNMTLTGARTASGHGNDVLADYYVIQAVQRGRGGVSSGDLGPIVVYRATGPSDRVPSACTTSSVAGLCNRYVAADASRPSTDFGCVGPPGPATKIDNAWCPTGRKTALTGANGPPDYVGVYVQAAYRSVTGVLAGNLTLRSDTIMRLEPRTLK